ncbi:hypothetical protein SAMD00019534_064300 [Acytostelium subglobosum LB1]|uniref:hypothetical protein n=1 Tax=Acytostelium subglobosum LB1 TaxID=1410327 RepID=UPI0006450BA4|nr:hypothetical protein SAMD00019534_064300 [Acytostelium subglobosum LB1]GAM23255.1 hypothetical protein SAMD00019534_064300 [Acytostelium subglobosum LB1]|eukprot:XP_012753704.1 hypothetical protein SAMD00019534_064300 [Acytostelium subglobosum LB1]
MNTKIIISLFLIFSASVALSASLNSYPFSLTQDKTATWTDGDGNVFSTFDCHLINLSEQTVTLTEVIANRAPVAVWGALSYSESKKFGLQSWAQQIQPNQTINFGYLVECANPISWSYCVPNAEAPASKK